MAPHVDPSINLSIIIEFVRRFELSWRLLLLSPAKALIEIALILFSFSHT